MTTGRVIVGAAVVLLASMLVTLGPMAQAQDLAQDLTPISVTNALALNLGRFYRVSSYPNDPPLPPLLLLCIPELADDPSAATNLFYSPSQAALFWDDRESLALGLASQAAMNGNGVMSQDDEQDEEDDSDSPTLDTTGLYLQLTNIDTAQAYLNLYNASNQVYAIWSTTNLASGWSVVTEVWPTNGDVMPFTVPTSNQDNLFLLAEDWTGVTENGNTTPDWWFWRYFGTVALSDTNLDSQGNTLLYDYSNGLDPNVIAFFLATTNQHSSTSLTPVQLNLTAGVPASMAVLVDSTNQAAATWMPYTPTALADLGSTQGWHQVSVGLRGRMETSQQTWQSLRVKLLLTPPALALTNPASFTVDRPVIQLQGYSSEQLASLCYDLTNAAGLVTNVPGQLLEQYYDAANLEYTTNYFQCFDVQLTNGANIITLRATDFAGNTAVTNLTFTLDYSIKTNPPAITLGWPADGTRIGSPTFTWRGLIDDPTAQVAALLVDTNGVTNVISGRVGRAGDFWIENVPLPQATNLLALVVTDAAGNSSTNNLTVVQSDVTLTIDSVSLMDETAGGQVSDPTCTIWVNGTQAANNGDGTWTATGLQLTLDDTAVQARAIPQSDNGGAGSGNPSPGGHGVFRADLGNPNSAQATDAEGQVAWPEGAIYSRAIHYHDTADIPAAPPDPGYFGDSYADWQEETGGTGDFGFMWDPVDYAFWYYYYYTWQPGRWPDLGAGVALYTNTSTVYTQSWSTPYDGAWAETGWWTGDTQYIGPYDSILEYWHEHDQIVLPVGGAPGDNGLALYGISGGATAYVPGYSDPSYYPVPPQNIQFGALGNLDTNGFLLAAVEKRSTVDITPTVNGMNYGIISALPTQYKLIIQTVSPTPTNRARSTLGVGEQVDISLSPALPPYAAALVGWTTTAGSVYPQVGNQTRFTAPSNAATATVTMHYHAPNYRAVAFPTKFTVIEPTGVDHADFVQYGSYTSTTLAGAGVQLRPYIGPTNVSFYRVQIMEVGQNATNVSGYFTTNNAPSHIGNGADVWIDLDYDNHWKDTGGGTRDWVTSYGWPPPWYGSSWFGGSYTWAIPALWRVVGTTNQTSMAGWSQVHQLSSNGTMTVSKFGHSVSRTIQGNYSGQ